MTIVCAVPDDERALPLVDAARRLGRATGLGVCFVRVMRGDAPIVAERTVRRALGALGVPAAELRLEVGQAPYEVARVAVSAEATLIVCASDRRGRLGRAVTPSGLPALQAVAPCPVVILPPRAELAFDGNPVVAVIDPCAASAQAVAAFAQRMSALLGARLLFAEVPETRDLCNAQVDALLEAADDAHASLLVAAHDPSALSLAADLAVWARRPVAIVPPGPCRLPP